MAHRILGVDLGAYSVKVIVANPGLRHAHVTDFIERPVPPGDEPYEVRAARVLGAIVREEKLGNDFPYAAAAGDKLFIHVLEFPFKGLRRLELEKAVGAELESILPVDLEEMVFGFESIPPDVAESPWMQPAGAAAELPISDDDPTQVKGHPVPGIVHGRLAPPTSGMRVLACAMEIDRARQLIELIGDQAPEPRGLVAAPASYARVAENIPRLTGDKKAQIPAVDAPIAIIDVGHERTDVCVIKGGRAVFTRTITRGGRQVTDTIARSWKLTFEEAQKAKHTDGFIGSAAEPPQTEDWQRVHDVVIAEIGPLAKDIKRTLASCRAKTGASVAEIILVGGGSRLRGLASFFIEKLGVPVSTLSAQDAAGIFGEKLATTGAPVDVACLAAGVAFEGATGRPHFDLRQGDLAYKADLSFLRQKAVTLAAAALVIIAFAAVNAYASLYSLRTNETNLSRRLALETAELFGEPLSADEARLRTQGKTSGTGSPLPRMTAYDIMLEISSQLPDRKEVTIDVDDLEIKAGKISISASAKASDEIDKVEEALKKIECFNDVTRGNTSRGVNDTFDFKFSINSSCMGTKAAK